MNKLLSIVFLLVLFSGCGQGGGDAKGNDYVVTIKTEFGDMIAILYDETPKHKENFIKLAKEKYFDGMLFHRVIKDFMIQGGDPDSKNATPDQHLGMGGPGYTIPAEINPKFFHEKGALSAARLGDDQNPNKESSGSQFYIVQGKVMTDEELEGMKFNQQKLMGGLRQMYQSQQHQPLFDSLQQLYASGDMQRYQSFLFSIAPRIEKATGTKIIKELNPAAIEAYKTVGGTPFLDDEYTVFGKVIKGLEVVDKITAQPMGNADRPVTDIKMTVTVEEMSRAEVTKKYGYQYN